MKKEKREKKAKTGNSEKKENIVAKKIKDIFLVLRRRKNFSLLVALLTAMAVFAAIYGVTMPRRYPLKVGMLSVYDISAPFDMEDRAQTERYAEDAAKAVPKAYVRSADLSDAIVSRAEEFIGVINSEHNAYRDTLMKEGPALSAEDIKSLCDESVTRLVEKAVKYRISISREEASSIITEITRAELDSFFSEFLSKIKDISDNQDVTPDNYYEHTVSLQRSIQQTMYANQNLKNVTSLFAGSVLNVNVVADEELTKSKQDSVRDENLARKIIIPKGKRIISVDEHVTQAQYQLLNAYNLIEDGSFDVERLFKVIFVLLGLLLLFYYYLSGTGMEPMESNSQLLQLGCVIIAVLGVCRLLYPVHRLAMPIYIAPILIAYLINARVALIINIYILSALALFTGIDVGTMLFFMIAGALSALMMINTTTRTRFILVAFALGASCSVIYIMLTNDIFNPSAYITDVTLLFVTCISSTFISMGLIAMLESLFNTATPLRLTELTSGNTQLFKRLSFEAPGTHHHSLMVGYMAENAAQQIGANPFITKAGAYYHDVGKLAAPEYFAENQYGHNPHDLLTPEESCRIISAHTTAGVELCEKNKLPRQVINIVREHHGDTVLAYFYSKAVKLYGEANVSKEAYRYPGPRPSSRESALVMLADSCEAAVRSSNQKDEAIITDWVHKIIRSKIDDGQLRQCTINMQDLNLIEQSYIRVLTAFYHTRISYPEDTKAGAARVEAGAADASAGPEDVTAGAAPPLTVAAGVVAAVAARVDAAAVPAVAARVEAAAVPVSGARVDAAAVPAVAARVDAAAVQAVAARVDAAAVPIAGTRVDAAAIPAAAAAAEVEVL